MKSLSFAVMVMLLLAQPLLACPEETVDHGTIELRNFAGRIISLGDELLPVDIEQVHFVLRSIGEKDREQWNVPVSPDGTFLLALPEGSYQFELKVEGFLFTLIGKVEIKHDADADRKLELHVPWC